MTALLFVLVGMVLATVLRLGYVKGSGFNRTEAQLAGLEALRAERRLQRVAQQAVAELLAIARERQ